MKLIFSFIIILFLLAPQQGHAENKHRSKHKHIPLCYASAKVNRVYVPSRVKSRLKSAAIQTATIEVSYSGFSEEAQAAFAYAVSLWEQLISSPITIHIHANWSPLASNVLGSCTASDHLENFDSAALANHFYPIALAEKIAGKELNSSDDPDIIAQFNSNNANWYFGTDGQTPDDKYDFVTTVMHEIAHGLGFNGMCYEPSDGIGAYSWTTDHPAIFDDFMINLDGQKLTDENIFANYSAELMAEFESGYLDFAGEWSKTKLNGSYPRLYAPLSYDEGSSLYHLNELSYNNENALMTPAIGKGEAIHDPGIALTMLEETGWINTTISHQELTDTEELSAPLEVTAAIVSDKGLDSTSVQLIYTDADFSTADSLSMTWLQANDLFSAEIPVTEAATFQYYLTAQNIEGRRFRLPADAPQSYFDVHVGPDQQAPVIAHDPVKIMLENNQTAAITAVVSDNIAVSDVELEYAANKEAFQTLSLNSDGDSYETNLSFSDLVDGDSIRYRLIATDSSSQSNTTSSPADGYYTISVEGYYAPLTTYSNDFNNTSRDFISTDFYIGTELGFENGSLNSPHPYPSPNANDESYNLSCTLKHPIILEENGKMNFNEVVLVEPGDDGAVYGSDNFWDYVIVEGSLDGTTNWLPLTDGYDAGQNSPWLSAYESSTVGRSDLLLPHEINLTENGNFSAGQTVYIRFRLYSDPFVNGWGWVIDDLVIQDPKTASETMLASSGTFSFYPNPVKSKLFIEANLATAPGKIRYQLQTTSGQQIQSGIFDGQSQQLTEKLDLSMLTPGFYFLVLDFENGERFSQKIIRQ